jgi:hypothetical protein
MQYSRIKHSEKLFEPNTWTIEELRDAQNSKAINFTCPNGHTTNLFIENRSDPDKDWHIETEGEVTPSVFCHGLVNGPECGYHEFIKLEDWNSWKHHPHKQ